MRTDSTDLELALMLLAAVAEHISDRELAAARPSPARHEEAITLDDAIDEMLAPDKRRHPATDHAAQSLRRAQAIIMRLNGLPAEQRLAALRGAIQWVLQCRDLVLSLSRPDAA